MDEASMVDFFEMSSISPNEIMDPKMQTLENLIKKRINAVNAITKDMEKHKVNPTLAILMSLMKAADPKKITRIGKVIMKKTIPILIFINNLSIKISALFLLKPLAYRLPFCCKRNKLLNYPERINRRAIYSSSIISKPEDIAASKGNAMALKEVNELKGSKMIIPLYFLLFFNIKKENTPDEKSKWF